MRRRHLTDFMPVYTDNRTGQIVIDEPDMPTVEPSAPVLPELGNLPERMPTGTRVIIGKHNLELVRAGKADDDAPQYRLRHNLTLTGNSVFTVDDLNIMGAKLLEER